MFPLSSEKALKQTARPIGKSCVAPVPRKVKVAWIPLSCSRSFYLLQLRMDV